VFPSFSLDRPHRAPSKRPLPVRSRCCSASAGAAHPRADGHGYTQPDRHAWSSQSGFWRPSRQGALEDRRHPHMDPLFRARAAEIVWRPNSSSANSSLSYGRVPSRIAQDPKSKRTPSLPDCTKGSPMPQTTDLAASASVCAAPRSFDGRKPPRPIPVPRGRRLTSRLFGTRPSPAVSRQRQGQGRPAAAAL